MAERKKKEIKEETETGMRGIERVKNREPHAKLPVAFICSIISPRNPWMYSYPNSYVIYVESEESRYN